MKPLTPNEIRQAVHGRWLARGADVMVEGVSIDSRAAGPGQLFVAIKGDRHDGHDYLRAAAAAEAIAGGIDIIGPECAIPLGVPLANLQAIAAAGKSFGS